MFNNVEIKMKRTSFVTAVLGILAAFLLVVFAFAQDTPSVSVKSIKMLPPVDEVTTGSCASDRSGYLYPPDGRQYLADAEVGKYVTEALARGEVLTLYPTKKAIFVAAVCNPFKGKEAIRIGY